MRHNFSKADFFKSMDYFFRNVQVMERPENIKLAIRPMDSITIINKSMKLLKMYFGLHFRLGYPHEFMITGESACTLIL